MTESRSPATVYRAPQGASPTAQTVPTKRDGVLCGTKCDEAPPLAARQIRFHDTYGSCLRHEPSTLVAIYYHKDEVSEDRGRTTPDDLHDSPYGDP